MAARTHRETDVSARSLAALMASCCSVVRRSWNGVSYCMPPLYTYTQRLTTLSRRDTGGSMKTDGHFEIYKSRDIYAQPADSATTIERARKLAARYPGAFVVHKRFDGSCVEVA